MDSYVGPHDPPTHVAHNIHYINLTVPSRVGGEVLHNYSHICDDLVLLCFLVEGSLPWDCDLKDCDVSDMEI